MNEYQLADLRKDMANCEQTHGLSVLAHGYSVSSYFHDLRNHVINGEPLKYEWRLPEWVADRSLWDSMPDISIIDNYHIYHDCGKPYCLEVDDEGKRHFPNHADVSASKWESLGGDPLEVDFMRRDMDIHLLKADGIEKFMEFEHWPTLLFTGLAEIHANASMFGGIGSTSFKIKWKNINKRGNAIIKRMKENG